MRGQDEQQPLQAVFDAVREKLGTPGADHRAGSAGL